MKYKALIILLLSLTSHFSWGQSMQNKILKIGETFIGNDFVSKTECRLKIISGETAHYRLMTNGITERVRSNIKLEVRVGEKTQTLTLTESKSDYRARSNLRQISDKNGSYEIVVASQLARDSSG